MFKKCLIAAAAATFVASAAQAQSLRSTVTTNQQGTGNLVTILQDSTDASTVNVRQFSNFDQVIPFPTLDTQDTTENALLDVEFNPGAGLSGANTVQSYQLMGADNSAYIELNNSALNLVSLMQTNGSSNTANIQINDTAAVNQSSTVLVNQGGGSGNTANVTLTNVAATAAPGGTPQLSTISQQGGSGNTATIEQTDTIDSQFTQIDQLNSVDSTALIDRADSSLDYAYIFQHDSLNDSATINQANNMGSTTVIIEQVGTSAGVAGASLATVNQSMSIGATTSVYQESFAGLNTLTVTQQNVHTALVDVDQYSTNGGTATITQIGIGALLAMGNNVIGLAQSGLGGDTATIVQNIGASSFLNYIDVKQQGANGSATVTQDEARDSEAHVLQTGDLNAATVTQDGVDDYLEIDQSGIDTVATVSQTGTGGLGNGNFAYVTQSAGLVTATVTQIGSLNTANITQY